MNADDTLPLEPREPIEPLEPFEPLAPLEPGGWIRAARRARRLSQREFAAKAGMPAASVARIESGRVEPTLASLVRLLAAAGCALVAVDHRGHLLQRDDVHDAIRDRGGRRFPAHLVWGGRPVYMGNERNWWGWHNIAWYRSDDPAVPDHVYWHRTRFSWSDGHSRFLLADVT